MKPLTIEELKSLKVGDWVWVESETYGKTYSIVNDIDKDGVLFSAISLYGWLAYCNYGNTWLAYKNKEQAESNSKIVELQEPYLEEYGNGVFVRYQKVENKGEFFYTKEEAERRLAELKGEKV